ncbi:MAG: hypothetical protein AMXMBFR46_19960 [Acidimicrobiia bacterium]
MSDAPSVGVRVVAIYPVRDYEEFRAQFQGTTARQTELGVRSSTLHRSVDNPNEVMVTFEMRSAADALAMFTADDRIRAWMDRAGVEVYPAVFVGTPASEPPP